MISHLFENTTILVHWQYQGFQIENDCDLNPAPCTTAVILQPILLRSSPEWFLGTHCCGLKSGNLWKYHGRSDRNDEQLPLLHVLADLLVQLEATGQAGLPGVSFQSPEGQEWRGRIPFLLRGKVKATSKFNTVRQLTPSPGGFKTCCSLTEVETQESSTHTELNAHIPTTSVPPPPRHSVSEKDAALTGVPFSYLACFSSKVCSSVFRRFSTT